MFVNMGWEYCTNYYRERYFVLFAAWGTTPLPQHSRIWFFHMKYTGLPYRITLYLTPTLTYYIMLIFSPFFSANQLEEAPYTFSGVILRDTKLQFDIQFSSSLPLLKKILQIFTTIIFIINHKSFKSEHAQNEWVNSFSQYSHRYLKWRILWNKVC